MRVLCAGHVNWDVTLRVDGLPEPDGEARVVEHHQSGGGSAANSASVLATLGIPSGILGSLGTDQHGFQARRELVDAGVDTAHLVETAVGTATKYLVVDPDGRVMVLGDDRGNEAFHADDVSPDVLGSLDHLHLTGQRPETAAELAAVAGEAGVRVSVDPGRRVGDRGFGMVLDRANVVFLTDREARSVGIDPEDPDDRPVDRVVVIKYGPDGAEVRSPSGVYSHPGYEVDPVDTTGAGDAFAAGFLAALLDGWDPRSPGDPSGPGASGEHTAGENYDGGHAEGDPDYDRALVVANACGALAARRTGARVHVTRRDVERFLAGR